MAWHVYDIIRHAIAPSAARHFVSCDVFACLVALRKVRRMCKKEFAKFQLAPAEGLSLMFLMSQCGSSVLDIRVSR